MTDSVKWAVGFARQADADFRAWELFEKHPQAVAASCHKLLFLQMACEKLCKACVLRANVCSPAAVQASHGFIAKHLPMIVRQEMGESSAPLRKKRAFQKMKQLAGEIDVLSPAIDRGGRRPDNCEYPWQMGDRVQSPLDWNFTSANLLTAPTGRTLLKCIRAAINRAMPDEKP